MSDYKIRICNYLGREKKNFMKFYYGFWNLFLTMHLFMQTSIFLAQPRALMGLKG